MCFRNCFNYACGHSGFYTDWTRCRRRHDRGHRETTYQQTLGICSACIDSARKEREREERRREKELERERERARRVRRRDDDDDDDVELWRLRVHLRRRSWPPSPVVYDYDDRQRLKIIVRN